MIFSRQTNKRKKIQPWNRYKNQTRHLSSYDSPESIGIPGCSYICSPTKSNLIRFFWACAVTACIIAFLRNAGSRLMYFLYQDPEVKIENKMNESVQFPSVTICPQVLHKNPLFTEKIVSPDQDQNYSNSYSKLAIDPVFDVIEKEKINLLKLWDETDDYFEDITGDLMDGRSILNSSVESKQNLKITQIYSSTGRCHHFSSDSPVKIQDYFTEYSFSILHNTAPGKYWILVLAHPEEALSITQYFHIYDAQYLRMGQLLNIVYQATEKIKINSTKRHCLDAAKVEECKFHCLENFMYSHLKDNHCRLPNMNPRNGLPICNHLQFRKMYSEFEKYLFDFRDHKCNCPFKCREVLFSISFNNYNEGPSNYTAAYIKVQKIITLETEYWSYSFSAFLSEIGGFLGLFLGICILSFVEILVALFYQFKRFFLKLLKKTLL